MNEKTVDSRKHLTDASEDLGMEEVIRNKINSKYSLIDISFSYNCLLKCRHCMFNCTPHDSRTRLNKEKIYKYIDSALEVDKFKEYAFGEQEIFFDIRSFIAAAEYLNKKVKNPSITTSTSSFWVKSYEYAREQLSQLQKLGLNGILLSIDDFHLEFVDIEKILNCTKASLDLGIDVSLQTIISKGSRRKIDFMKYFQRKIPHQNVYELDWIEHNFTPVGRGAFIDESLRLYENNPLIGDCSILEIISITPEGQVIPCCGSGSVAKYLSIGNIEEKSLSEIIKEVEVNPFINSLFVWLGPYGLIKMLEYYGKSLSLSKRHTGVCHACYEIFSNRDIYSFLAEKLNDRIIEFFTTRWFIEKKYSN